MAAARAEADHGMQERGQAKQIQAMQDLFKRVAEAGERVELPGSGTAS